MGHKMDDFKLYVGIERQPSGGVQAWLHRAPGTEGMSSETLNVRYFLPREAAGWTDEEALEQAKEWARAWLKEIGSDRDLWEGER